jgi:hypothetical protein
LSSRNRGYTDFIRQIKKIGKNSESLRLVRKEATEKERKMKLKKLNLDIFCVFYSFVTKTSTNFNFSSFVSRSDSFFIFLRFLSCRCP